jgi:hypothetical protein
MVCNQKELENNSFEGCDYSLVYPRRTRRKRNFLDGLVVIAERVAFVMEGLTWTKDRLERQMVSNEIWAVRGEHTASYVTIKQDGTAKYDPYSLRHKHSNAPAWIFHGTAVKGIKGLAKFWER